MKTVFVLIFSFLQQFCFSQSNEIVIDVISSSGGNYSNSEINLDFTLGEPIAGFVGNDMVSLNQGFQQALFQNIIFTSIYEDQDLSLNVYPNPFYNEVYIKNEEGLKLKEVVLINTLGEIVKHNTSSQITNTISTDFIPAGAYFLRITTEDNKSNTYTLIKTK